MPAVPGVRPPLKALCVVPLGMEEGTEVELPAREFGLVVGEPAEFRFLGSSTRRDDHVGTLLDAWDDDELEELPPLADDARVEGPRRRDRARAPAGARHRGRRARAVVRQPRRRQRWKLEFNVRAPH